MDLFSSGTRQKLVYIKLRSFYFVSQERAPRVLWLSSGLGRAPGERCVRALLLDFIFISLKARIFIFIGRSSKVGLLRRDF